jgi:hypothetical protein
MDAGAFLQFLSSRRAEIACFCEKFGIGEIDAIEAFYTAEWASQRYESELESKREALEANLRQLLPSPEDPRLNDVDPWRDQNLRWEALGESWVKAQGEPDFMERQAGVKRAESLAESLRELDSLLPYDTEGQDEALLHSVTKPVGRKDWKLRTKPGSMSLVKWWVNPLGSSAPAKGGVVVDPNALMVPLCLWDRKSVAAWLGFWNEGETTRRVDELGLSRPKLKLVTLSKDGLRIFRRDKAIQRNRKL